MSVFLREKKMKNGGFSMYLEFNINRLRSYEFLNIHLKPDKNELDKTYNQHQKRIAEIIRNTREKEVLEGTYNSNFKLPEQTDFFHFADSFIANHSGYNRGHIAVIKKLKSFWGKDKLFMPQINARLLNDFNTDLEKSLMGETSSSYMKKLKAIIKEAYNQKLIRENPAVNIKSRPFLRREKDVLSPKEIVSLINSNCPNLEVKNAFIFSCMTGLRWCDVKELKGVININDNTLKVIQKKTKQHITIVLNETAVKILAGRNSEYFFNLPSHTTALKSLAKWMVNAKINKHIGFHNARHSFATNLIASGADVFITSKLLGHTSLRHTTRYLRDNIKLKENAVTNLENQMYE